MCGFVSLDFKIIMKWMRRTCCTSRTILLTWTSQIYLDSHSPTQIASIANDTIRLQRLRLCASNRWTISYDEQFNKNCWKLFHSLFILNVSGLMYWCNIDTSLIFKKPSFTWLCINILRWSWNKFNYSEEVTQKVAHVE